MNPANKPLTIAIQSNGRLREPSLAYLNSLGFNIASGAERSLTANCKNTQTNIIFVRHRDIPLYVRQGLADFGIVGANVIAETAEQPLIYESLNFGRCSLVLAVPNVSNIITPAGLAGQRIATSYPESLKQFLNKQNIMTEIVELRGSVEVAPLIGLSDAICDITQSGDTLRANNLKIIGKVYDSSAVCIINPRLRQQTNNQPLAQLIKQYANSELQPAV